jgi:hypothetical protein
MDISGHIQAQNLRPLKNASGNIVTMVAIIEVRLSTSNEILSKGGTTMNVGRRMGIAMQ